MIDLKVICPTCKGKGCSMVAGVERYSCDDCNGKGYTDPPQEILDDLECAEIERELLKKSYKISYDIWLTLAVVTLSIVPHEEYSFSGKTKLEALRHAKRWIEGRG